MNMKGSLVKGIAEGAPFRGYYGIVEGDYRTGLSGRHCFTIRFFGLGWFTLPPDTVAPVENDDPNRALLSEYATAYTKMSLHKTKMEHYELEMRMIEEEIVEKVIAAVVEG